MKTKSASNNLILNLNLVNIIFNIKNNIRNNIFNISLTITFTIIFLFISFVRAKVMKFSEMCKFLYIFKFNVKICIILQFLEIKSLLFRILLLYLPRILFVTPIYIIYYIIYNTNNNV